MIPKFYRTAAWITPGCLADKIINFAGAEAHIVVSVGRPIVQVQREDAALWVVEVAATQGRALIIMPL